MQTPSARDRPPPADAFLVDRRRMFDELALADVDDQIAPLIQGELARTAEAQPDRIGVSARRKAEVILELALGAAVVDQIDSRIDILELDFSVVGNIGMPSFRVIADEIVAPPRYPIDAADLRRPRRPLERN